MSEAQKSDFRSRIIAAGQEIRSELWPGLHHEVTPLFERYLFTAARTALEEVKARLVEQHEWLHVQMPRPREQQRGVEDAIRHVNALLAILKRDPSSHVGERIEQDHGAALLPVDPSATVKTEALPTCRYRGKGDPPQECDYPECGCDLASNTGSNLRTEPRPNRGKTMSEWQPIESAPKDGTWVLLLFPEWWLARNQSQPRCVITQWVPNAFVPGWRSIMDAAPKPTHWMPLPAPPVIGSGNQLAKATASTDNAQERSAKE